MTRCFLIAAATVLLSLTLSATATAQPRGYRDAWPGHYPGAWRSTQRERQTSAKDVVREGMGKLMGFIAGGGAQDEEKLQTWLEQEIAPYFDFHAMSIAVEGNGVHSKPEHQHTKLERGLRNRILGAMAGNLMQMQLSFNAPESRSFASRSSSRGKAQVSIRIKQRGQRGISLDFLLHRTDKGWKIYDISVDHTSAVAYYRNRFREMVKKYGIDKALLRF